MENATAVKSWITLVPIYGRFYAAFFFVIWIILFIDGADGVAEDMGNQSCRAWDVALK